MTNRRVSDPEYWHVAGGARVLRRRFEPNPADHPGVVVYRPNLESNFHYNPETRGVVDSSTGNKFWVQSGHNQAVSRFGVATPDLRQIVQGLFYRQGGGVYVEGLPANITDIAITFRPASVHEDALTLMPFDAEMLGKFFRAHVQGTGLSMDKFPCHILVVDSRAVRLVE